MPFRSTSLRNYFFSSSSGERTQSADGLSLADRLAEGMDARLERRPLGGVREAAAHILGPNVVNRRILMVAEPASAVHEHIGWLDRYTRGVYAYASLTEAEDAARVSPDETLTLVSMDMFVNLNVAIDLLSGYRRARPERVVVIASRQFSMHDMTCERGAIADASLRLPAGRPELALCLGAAVTNNGYIRARQRLI